MSMTDLAQQVADLTTATTQLTQEVVGQKDRLTAAADAATGNSGSAASSAAAAAQSASDANLSALAAEQSKNEASQISGLDTVEDAVDLALSEFAGVMSASERDAILAQNEAMYAASGFVNYGKSDNNPLYNYWSVNEGLWGDTDDSNTIRMGRDDSTGKGTSKTGNPVVHLAGAVSKIVNVNTNSNIGINYIYLPPSPDGTEVTDSSGDCRGTGKVSLNLATEIDPKYGNVPTGTEVEIKNEAVARAFEGDVTYGDFRDNNSNGSWINGDEPRGSVTFSEGKMTVIDEVSDTLGAHGRQDLSFVPNTEYIAEYTLVSTTGDVTNFVRGNNNIPNYFPTHQAGDSGRFSVRFNSGDGGYNTNIVLYAPASTGTTVYSGVSIRKVTEEVVTDRVDAATLEQFDMVVKDDEVFDMIQSQSTTFGDTDVPTVESVKSDDFFAVYKGQQNIVKGRCVKWSTLTDVQKRKVAGYMKERLWINEDGDLTFTTLGQRSFAGVGNGDWDNISSIGGTSLRFDSAQNLVQAKGIKDSVDDFTKETSKSYVASNHPNPLIPELGVFSLRDNADKSEFAYKGRCFMYVLGTVSRLNQGAYHPSLNPTGASTWVGESDSGHRYWNDLAGLDAPTRQDCFRAWAVGEKVPCLDSRDGSISSARSGRDNDGRFYDGIYEGGLGGVIDLRLGAVANDSHEESSKVLAKVFDSTYRGMEKLVWTFVNSETQVPTAGASSFSVEDSSVYKVGDTIHGVLGGILEVSAKITGIRFGAIDIDTTFDRQSGTYEFVVTTPVKLSVSGNFEMKDVIGDPAIILQTDALKNGWLGGWIPVIPDGTSKQGFPATRKALGSETLTRLINRQDGNGWVTIFPYSLSSNNWVAGTVSTGELLIVPYTAWAKMTKESTNKLVYSAKAGLMDVEQLADNRPIRGALLLESLIGKIATSSSLPQYGSLSLVNYTILNDSGELLSDGRWPLTHTPLTIAAPNNNSPAVKVLPYQISNNGQCSIGYQANELTFDTRSAVLVSGSDLVSANPSGTLINLRATKVAGYFIVVDRSYGGSSWDTYLDSGSLRIGTGGDIVGVSNNVILKFSEEYNGSWGDDGKIKITNSGSDTFVDLNGNVNKSVAHELALPHGWTHNHARAGTQTEGVDL